MGKTPDETFSVNPDLPFTIKEKSSTFVVRNEEKDHGERVVLS